MQGDLSAMRTTLSKWVRQQSYKTVQDVPHCLHSVEQPQPELSQLYHAATSLTPPTARSCQDNHALQPYLKKVRCFKSMFADL